MTDTRTEAPTGRNGVYDQGRAARRKGLERHDNPWAGHSVYHGMWDNGWTDSDTMLRALGQETDATLPTADEVRGILKGY